MKSATLEQGIKVLSLISQKGTPCEQLQKLLASGLLPDLLDANLDVEIDRQSFQEAIRRKIQSSFRIQSVLLPRPADNEEFELTLEPTDPMEMVVVSGYDPFRWGFKGSEVSLPLTRRFKLVHVSYCFWVGEVQEKLRTHGSIPKGQWREAFKKAFPGSNGGAIGFADPSWLRPDGHALFPVLDSYCETWRSDFRLNTEVMGLDWISYWRWLVEVD